MRRSIYSKMNVISCAALRSAGNQNCLIPDKVLTFIGTKLAEIEPSPLFEAHYQPRPNPSITLPSKPAWHKAPPFMLTYPIDFSVKTRLFPYQLLCANARSDFKATPPVALSIDPFLRATNFGLTIAKVVDI